MPDEATIIYFENSRDNLFLIGIYGMNPVVFEP